MQAQLIAPPYSLNARLIGRRSAVRSASRKGAASARGQKGGAKKRYDRDGDEGILAENDDWP